MRTNNISDIFKYARIGMDFDNTLSTSLYQVICHYLQSLGKDIYVITKRTPLQNKEVYEITDNLLIPRSKVMFTSNGPKSPFIIENNIQVFIDDLQENLDEIDKNAPDTLTYLAK